MDATLEAVKREGRGKNEANRLRASGKIPGGVLWSWQGRQGAGRRGGRGGPQGRAAHPAFRLRANTLINLKLEGLEARVMVREYQLDPVTHHLLHADFYQLAMDKAIVVTVPIVVKGEAKGVKQQVACSTS